MTVQIIQDFIPSGRRNRPGYKLTPKYITIHDTANTQAGADAKAHAAYLKKNPPASEASWHFTVDDKVIYQHLPLNENGWHAGDGANGPGNRQSIGIEICENRDGNRAAAEANAAWLVAKLLKDHGLSIDRVRQHYDWSGKNCPRVLRNKPGGWADFLAAVEGHLKPAVAPSDALYRVQIGAFKEKANAEACLARAKKAGFADAFIAGGAVPTPKPEPAPAIKVGDKVRVKEGATDYNGTKLADFVYSTVYDVIQVGGDRVVIGKGKVVTAAVRLKDLTLV